MTGVTAGTHPEKASSEVDWLDWWFCRSVTVAVSTGEDSRNDLGTIEG